MKTHTTKGYEIIRGFKLNDDEEQERYSLDIAKYHHERWDGKGYPEGLQGDEIPLWSQIVGIVDVYDALVSPRVYKKAFSHGNDTGRRMRYIQSDSFRMSEGCGGTIEK